MQLVQPIKHQLKNDPSPRKLPLINKSATGYNLLSDQTGSLVSNTGASGAIQINLPASAEAGTFFDFVVAVAQELRINPPDGGAIIINGAALTDGAYVSADAINESVRLVAVGGGSNDWRAMFTIGTWSSE